MLLLALLFAYYIQCDNAPIHNLDTPLIHNHFRIEQHETKFEIYGHSCLSKFNCFGSTPLAILPYSYKPEFKSNIKVQLDYHVNVNLLFFFYLTCFIWGIYMFN
eukprot:NODE_830_length_3646_cov_0.455314.p4 type:complete len:104 gc:universal NODE_830_length_3646_cov_0.455314:718-1029(+)